MARSFTSTDSVVTTGLTAIDTGSYTIGAWIFPTTAQQGGIVIVTDNPVNFGIHQLRYENGSGNLRMYQEYTTAAADAVSSTALATNAWYAVFGTFNSADSKTRLYWGTLTASVAEMAYTTQIAGSGTRRTAGVKAISGNNNAGNIPFAGRIQRPFIYAGLMALQDMENYRLGLEPIQDGNLRLYWPLDSPTASQAEDLSGNTLTGTVTGTTVVENTPVLWGPHGITVRRPPAVALIATGAFQ